MNNRKLFGSELCSDPADKCKKKSLYLKKIKTKK